MSKVDLILKINNQLESWHDFIRQKIEFIYQVDNFVDMEYNYFDDYEKIPCDVDFHSLNFDLILEFKGITKSQKERIVEDLKNYDLEITSNQKIL